MTRIAIVNHSDFGHTRRQAEFVHAGVCRAGTDGHLLPINDDGDNGDAWDTLRW
jgi:NAD(P)H dehydrogenase (quinone)